MPAHQIRIAALLVAYVLGCVALIAIGAAGGPQATSMVPAALNLTDLDDQAVDLAVDGAAVLAESASPLGDGWATMGSQAADFGRELSREIGPMVVIDQALGTQFGVVIAELAVVEQIAATTRSDMSETVRVQALAFTDQVKTRVDSEMAEAATATEHVASKPSSVASPAVQVAPVVQVSATARGGALLASMPIAPSELGFTIDFLGPRSGFRGLTYPFRRHIEIFVSPEWTDRELAHVISHEIGHAVDVVRNGARDHDRWRAARGISADTSWWAGAYASDFHTPGGDFAECYAAWVVGVPANPTTPFGSCAGTASLMRELVYS